MRRRFRCLQEPGRSPTTKSYMWIFRGGDPQKPSLIYRYAPTRSGSVASLFVKGYEGAVQTDGYVGYDFLDADESIVHLGCWAHVRRTFMDAAKAGSAKVEEKRQCRCCLGLYQETVRHREAGKDPESECRTAGSPTAERSEAAADTSSGSGWRRNHCRWFRRACWAKRFPTPWISGLVWSCILTMVMRRPTTILLKMPSVPLWLAGRTGCLQELPRVPLPVLPFIRWSRRPNPVVWVCINISAICLKISLLPNRKKITGNYYPSAFC